MSSGFLLGTNVPSELTKPVPGRVSNWVLAQENTSLHLSVVSVAELRKGISLLPQSNRRLRLEGWFAGRAFQVLLRIGVEKRNGQMPMQKTLQSESFGVLVHIWTAMGNQLHP